ncbi:rod shape-determining protein MreD, partial [Bacillus cereus]|nr:rod shape-determining protein MreD [Bacillus cereus]
MLKILISAALPLLCLFVFLFENMFATVCPTVVFWKDSIAAPHCFINVLCFIT